MASYGDNAGAYYPPPPGPPPPPPQQQGYYTGGDGQQSVKAEKPAPPPPQGRPPSYDELFRVERPKWNDLWAALLFFLVCAGFVFVSAISLHGYAATRGSNQGGINNQSNKFSLTTHTIYLFVWVLCAATLLSWGYVNLARAFAKQFIWITGILNIVFSLVLAIYMLARRYWSGGIVFLIFGLFAAFCFYTWIPRIPFSALMLRTSVDVSKRHGHVYLVSALGGLLAAALAAWYAVTLVAVYVKFEPAGAGNGENPACKVGVGGACSSAKVAGLVAFITFAAYWISEVLKNTVHTTIAGVYGSWYFAATNYPRRVTRGALRRALTYSFGSICFGSLVVAIINFLRHLCSVAQQQSAASGDLLGSVMFCVLSCLIGLLDWVVQFVNRYAFSHIALYGKAYIPAAKDTWRMIKDRGIDALVNECLIGPVLSMGAMFVGYACALLGYLYLIFTRPDYNKEGSFTPIVVAISFLIGLQVCQVFTTPLTSGIDTIFVATAWDPEVLRRDHSDLYIQMVQVYPHVAEAIHA